MKKILFLLSALCPLLLFSQTDWEAVVIKNIPVKGNISYLEGRGGNVGVLTGEDGILIVDDQYAELSDKISQTLSGLSSGDLKYILNTHYHGDHTGGNENLSADGATIVAHENVKKRLSTPFYSTMWDREVEAKPEGFWPTETFKGVKRMSFNGEEIEIHHVPNGHTDGDVLVYFKTSNVIHAGDLFVRYGFPFIDVSAGGSINGMIKAQNNIKKLASSDTKIIPGHGKEANYEDVEEFLGMLTGTRDIIADIKKQGKTLDECISMNPLEDYKERWDTGGFISADVFVRFIYETLD
jgi:cyclase